MGIYGLTLKNVSRGAGQSVVAKAAYQAREKLRDKRTGRLKSYTRREEELVDKTILFPAGVPKLSREELWNSVEARSKRKDARLARAIVLTIPRELSQQGGRQAVVEFAEKAIVSKQLPCDIAWHNAKAIDGGPNPHAHLLFPDRALDEKKRWGKKKREINRKAWLEEVRLQWEQAVNRQLAREHQELRVSRLSRKALADRAEKLGELELAQALRQKKPEPKLGWRRLRAYKAGHMDPLMKRVLLERRLYKPVQFLTAALAAEIRRERTGGKPKEALADRLQRAIERRPKKLSVDREWFMHFQQKPRPSRQKKKEETPTIKPTRRRGPRR